MKRRLSLILPCLAMVVALPAQIIHIPADYPTIQQGINASGSGDTVLVAPGTYYENLILEHPVVLASEYLLFQDTALISATILDGNQAGPVINIDWNSGDTAVVCGFTVQNGNSYQGGGIFCNSKSPVLKNLIIRSNNATYGAGLYLSYSYARVTDVLVCDNNLNDSVRSYGGGICTEWYGNPAFRNVIVRNNAVYGKGGGIYINYCDVLLDSVDISGNKAINYVGNWGVAQTGQGGGMFLQSSNAVLSRVRVSDNSSGYGGGICFSYNAVTAFDTVHLCNIYLNDAQAGSDLYSNSGSDVSIVVDTFTVAYPTNYHAYPLSAFTFSIANGLFPQYNADLFVSPSGSNSNTGLTASDPLATIRHATSVILSDSLNPRYIILMNGYYSPSLTGEIFPVSLPDYVSLTGFNSSQVVLDAEGNTAVVSVESSLQNTICGMTLMNGTMGIQCENAGPVLMDLIISGNTGSGVYCSNNANPFLMNVSIAGNHSASSGGGLYCDYSSPWLENVIISGNFSDGYGGGLYVYYSNPVLKRVTIAENWSSQSGGGLYKDINSSVTFDSTDRCNIYLNAAPAGNDLVTMDPMVVLVDTFTVLNPQSYHAVPLSYFTFDIWNCKVLQVDTDLYVSPLGSNLNSGLTPADPLRTLHHAFSILLPDSLHPPTVYLDAGVYSPSANGEPMPVCPPGFINIEGLDAQQVILDAEGVNCVISASELPHCRLSGMTLQNSGDCGLAGSQSNLEAQDLKVVTNAGTGISCSNGALSLTNVLVSGNGTNGSFSSAGGGIYCYNSVVALDNVSVDHNGNVYEGGGIYLEGSAADLRHVRITDNSGNDGGGLFANNSQVFLSDVFITGNQASSHGGGILSTYSNTFTFDTATRCNIFFNTAPDGNDLYSSGPMNVIVDTFTVLYPNVLHASPLANFTFDILHGKVLQVNGDLYVSPSGDDLNLGTSPQQPLKTIRGALLRIVATPAIQNTIRLLEGTYSQSLTGEIFPVTLIDYVHLAGVADTLVVLDAEGATAVIMLDGFTTGSLSGMTLINSNNSGLSLNTSQPFLHHITIENCWYGLGFDNSSPSIEYLRIAHCTGYGIRLYNSNPVIRHCMVDNNGGYGIYFIDSSPVLKDVTISNNQGGIRNYNPGDLHMDSCLVDGNAGTGIYLESCTAEITNSTISDNLSSQTGGGVFCFHGLIRLKNVVLEGNQAINGGGIGLSYSNPVMENMVIRDNQATKGGGIYGYRSGQWIMNALVTGNHANDGGGLYTEYQSNALMENVTFAGNTAAGHGGAIYYYYSNPQVVNSILWGNTPDQVANTSANPVNIQWCDIEGGYTGTGNINFDPVFAGTGPAPYSLAFGSPCIDAGNPDTNGLFLPHGDLLGNVRVWDGNGDGVPVIDMGAYEFGAVPVGSPEYQLKGPHSLLLSVYPNPFFGSASVFFSLREALNVSVEVFNAFGARVYFSDDGLQPPGNHILHLNANNLPAGIYSVVLRAGGQKSAVRIIKL